MVAHLQPASSRQGSGLPITRWERSRPRPALEIRRVSLWMVRRLRPRTSIYAPYDLRNSCPHYIRCDVTSLESTSTAAGQATDHNLDEKAHKSCRDIFHPSNALIQLDDNATKAIQGVPSSSVQEPSCAGSILDFDLWCGTLSHHHICTTKTDGAIFVRFLILLVEMLHSIRGTNV
jgi:hypothetical protein